MTKWRELWRFENEDRTQLANLTQLADVDRGRLILSANDGGDEGWCSLDVAAVQQLRDALDEWLGRP